MYFDFTHTTHNPEPDYTKSILKIPNQVRERMSKRVKILYPEPSARLALTEIERIMQVFHAHNSMETKKATGEKKWKRCMSENS